MRPHDHKHVLEVRADVFGGEGESSGLLEHDGDDVIPDVTLPQQLQTGSNSRTVKGFTNLCCKMKISKGRMNKLVIVDFDFKCF